MSMSAEAFKSASFVTTAFCLIYVTTMVYQGVLKIRLKLAAAKRKERFERYGHVHMLQADRAVGNLLEWGVPFLALFWISMVISNGGTAYLGWGYVACRAAYPVVVMNGGLGTSGPKNMILLTTVPAYICLLGLLFNVARFLA